MLNFTIDPDTEDLLPLAEAARLPMLRRGARYAHPGTLARWAENGVNGVKLETIRVGARIFTTREAVERFVSALNGGRQLVHA